MKEVERIMNKRLVLLSVAACAAATTVAMAAGPRGRGDREAGPRWQAAKEQLNLTPEQSAKMDKLRIDFRKASIQRRAALEVAHLDLRQLMEATTIDESAVLATAQEVSDLQAAAFKARIEHRLAMRQILTPEQREKAKSLRHGRGFGDGPRGHMRGRPGRGQGPGAGGPGPSGEMMAPDNGPGQRMADAWDDDVE
jgi:Spy/CpxP family protein refolding chaperone